MRRGCIAISEVSCNGCGRTIRYGERYLAEDVNDGGISRLCVDCCTKKGFVKYRRDRGQETPTLFGEAPEMSVERVPDQTEVKPPKEKRKKSRSDGAGPALTDERERSDG
ncbi:MAG: hypothetical protein N3E40_02565 [Dehalococcoidia bacterium]|nr:hypothetical protein [Dehalococcoidia bacterium]